MNETFAASGLQNEASAGEGFPEEAEKQSEPFSLSMYRGPQQRLNPYSRTGFQILTKLEVIGTDECHVTTLWAKMTQQLVDVSSASSTAHMCVKDHT